MSQSRINGGERMIHQDYIARIRYSNALPPPPNPPKLLDIPSVGLQSGQYTTPSFASRLARQQPLNIEVDAELGMPLDYVGMPGVFDGDESSIQAPATAPPVHAHDRALLRHISALGKPKVNDTSVSFLRRTEYISANVTKKPDGVFLKKSGLKRPEKRKASPEPDKGTPAWFKRRIDRSFEAATRNLAAHHRVKHPTKRNVKCIEALPLLPDLDAFPDSGAYVTVKFTNNPVASGNNYDTRLLSGVFKPIERTAAEDESYNMAWKNWERDPKHHQKPSNMMNYNFFLPDNADTASRFRKCFDVENPDHADPALYTSNCNNDSDGPYFVFPRLRAYETSDETELDHETKYDKEVILASHNATNEIDKAVYYYPVMQISTIRSQRTKNIARAAGIAVTDEEESHFDELRVRVNDPEGAAKAALKKYKKRPNGELATEDYNVQDAEWDDE